MTVQYDFTQFEPQFMELLGLFVKAAKETGNGKILNCDYSLQFTNKNGNPLFKGSFTCPILEQSNQNGVSDK